MSLSRIPYEILMDIVHYLVLDMGMDRTWSLRLSSPAFAAAIEEDILTWHEKEILDLSQFDVKSETIKNRQSPIVIENMPSYLYNRLRIPLDANMQIIGKVQQLSQFIIDQRNISNEKDKENCTKQLCRGLVAAEGAEDLLMYLWSNPIGLDPWAKNQCLTVHDQVTAAIAMGDLEMAKTHISSIPTNEKRLERSHTFKDHLVGAINMRNEEMVKAILSCCPVEAVVSEKAGVVINNAFVRAMLAAISTDQSGPVKLLIGKYRDLGIPIKDLERTTWLVEAVKINNGCPSTHQEKDPFPVMKEILDTSDVKPWVKGHAISEMLHKGVSPEQISFLIDQCDIHPNKRLPENDTSILMRVVENGSLDIIQVFLEKGADPNEKVHCVNSETNLEMSPYQWAVHENKQDIVALFKRVVGEDLLLT